MRNYIMTFMLIMGLAGGLWSAPAQAQSCCAASQTAGPVRLSMGQTAAAGISADARAYTGRFVDTEYRSLEHPGVELRQTFYGAFRLGDSWQVGATIPAVQNRRQTATDVEWGAGLGDLSLQARYELVTTGMSMRWPGVGFTAQTTLPTGRAPAQSMERGTSLLMSDVTGAGLWAAGLGAQVEWVFQRNFLVLEAAGFAALPYTDAREMRVRPGMRSAGRLSFGRPVGAPFFWDETLYLASSAQVAHTFARTIDADVAAHSRERITTLSVQAGGYLTEHFYLMLRGSWDIPLEYAGQNRQVGPGVGLVLRRVFYDS